MKYEVVMGLEVHVELATNSKLFCSCSAKFGNAANENVCPACAGMPGLPAVANRQAVNFGIKAALVTNSEIAKVMTFDKKSYYYPDLPTGYQITQLYSPICTNGYVDIETEKGEKRINLKQIHIEEDAGKLVHDNYSRSLVDYNRGGVPLVEIVSMPDFRCADEVIAYLEKLKSLLTYAGVSDCRMQEGSMRCDVNISVREAGSEKLGTRTEIKNMNSLKAIARAIAYETERHIDALETGKEVLVQETRRWDDNKGESFSMRNKEDATDYRYFPNPEIMPIEISDEWINEIKSEMPEMAHEKLKRYQNELKLSEYDSKILTSSKNLSDIFDEAAIHCSSPKDAATLLLGELMSIIKTDEKKLDDLYLSGKKIAEIVNMLNKNEINRKAAKEILFEVYKNDADPKEYVKQHNLAVVEDRDLVYETAKQAISENEKSVLEYKGGNAKVLSFFFGIIMKKLGGKANPKTVQEILTELLDKW